MTSISHGHVAHTQKRIIMGIEDLAAGALSRFMRAAPYRREFPEDI